MPEADKPHGNLSSSEFLTAAEEGLLLAGAAQKCGRAPSPCSAPIVPIEAILPKDGFLHHG